MKPKVLPPIRIRNGEDGIERIKDVPMETPQKEIATQALFAHRGVRDELWDASALECPKMVWPNVIANENCSTRLHDLNKAPRVSK
jgi:hypothetical protein